eukprot:COSAG02_NODE_14013_length_1321_cov_41.096563_2_plen_113_part_00
MVPGTGTRAIWLQMRTSDKTPLLLIGTYVPPDYRCSPSQSDVHWALLQFITTGPIEVIGLKVAVAAERLQAKWIQQDEALRQSDESASDDEEDEDDGIRLGVHAPECDGIDS